MSVNAPNLMKHRPFQIVWIWDALCTVAGVIVYIMTDSVPALVGLALLGAIPLVVVLVRFSKANAAAKSGASDRSGDIVQ